MQEAAKKAHLEEEYNAAAKVERSYHAANIYNLGFSKDKKTEVWVDGNLNHGAVTDEEYHVASNNTEYAIFGVSSEEELKARYYHPDGSNLVAIPVVPNDPTNPLTPPMVVYQGTIVSEGKDWVTDVEQSIGMDTAEYNAVKKIAYGINKQYDDPSYQGPKVVFAGNSKGGGEANVSGALTGLNAYTTNAAGVNRVTVKDPQYYQSINYYLQDEFLHRLQSGPDHLLIAGNPVNDPARGSVVNIIPADPADAHTNYPFISEHLGDAVFRALQDIYDPLYAKVQNGINAPMKQQHINK